MVKRRLGLVATLALIGAPLSACQPLLPRDDTPTILPRLATAPNSGPSAQRMDANGYPLIGAYPKAATQQVSNEDVQATRDRFANVEARSVPPSDTAYRSRVGEMQTLAARQQAEAEARLRAASTGEAAGDAASSRAQ
ncbi:hypothetical protein [Aureimonas sp. AU40]|uniref:hypothetical protein n=1 Tax=Aureimonas sp. AU40 TaxID=1637747 RepID=UPI000AC71606|nr:hypothetical protein [Aureimonas sp. AU40]